MHVYMMVTRDKYELPVYVADTLEKLSEMANVRVNTIAAVISRYKHGKTGSCIYRKVELEEDEDED